MGASQSLVRGMVTTNENIGGYFTFPIFSAWKNCWVQYIFCNVITIILKGHLPALIYGLPLVYYENFSFLPWVEVRRESSFQSALVIAKLSAIYI